MSSVYNPVYASTGSRSPSRRSSTTSRRSSVSNASEADSEGTWNMIVDTINEAPEEVQKDLIDYMRTLDNALITDESLSAARGNLVRTRHKSRTCRSGATIQSEEGTLFLKDEACRQKNPFSFYQPAKCTATGVKPGHCRVVRRRNAKPAGVRTTDTGISGAAIFE